MIELKYSFQVTSDGEVKIQNRDKFLKDMSNFPNTLFTAKFKKASKKRTVRQNSFFHGIVVPIIKEHLLDLGWTQAYSNEWVKNYVKLNCLIIEDVNEETGETIKSIGETSELSTTEFMGFIERIQQWSIEVLDLYIPSPNEQLTIDSAALHNQSLYPTIER